MNYTFDNSKTKFSVELDVIDKGNFLNLSQPYHGVIKDCKLKNLAKKLIEMIEGYAYELDTDIDNLNYIITKIEVMED